MSDAMADAMSDTMSNEIVVVENTPPPVAAAELPAHMTAGSVFELYVGKTFRGHVALMWRNDIERERVLRFIYLTLQIKWCDYECKTIKHKAFRIHGAPIPRKYVDGVDFADRVERHNKFFDHKQAYYPLAPPPCENSSLFDASDCSDLREAHEELLEKVEIMRKQISDADAEVARLLSELEEFRSNRWRQTRKRRHDDDDNDDANDETDKGDDEDDGGPPPDKKRKKAALPKTRRVTAKTRPVSRGKVNPSGTGKAAPRGRGKTAPPQVTLPPTSTSPEQHQESASSIGSQHHGAYDWTQLAGSGGWEAQEIERYVTVALERLDAQANGSKTKLSDVNFHVSVVAEVVRRWPTFKRSSGAAKNWWNRYGRSITGADERNEDLKRNKNLSTSTQ